LPDGVGKRAYAAMEKAFYDEDMVIRVTGETIAITPPLIAGENEIAEIFDKVGKVIRAVA
jgi:beta-alanine--pyruvate transaminase